MAQRTGKISSRFVTLGEPLGALLTTSKWLACRLTGGLLPAQIGPPGHGIGRALSDDASCHAEDGCEIAGAGRGCKNWPSHLGRLQQERDATIEIGLDIRLLISY